MPSRDDADRPSQFRTGDQLPLCEKTSWLHKQWFDGVHVGPSAEAASCVRGVQAENYRRSWESRYGDDAEMLVQDGRMGEIVFATHGP